MNTMTMKDRIISLLSEVNRKGIYIKYTHHTNIIRDSTSSLRSSA
jgi:hypothetical protein